MASTYTPLGVELMATGENAGTWGTKTNANLNLVSQLTGGFAQVSIAGGAGTTALDIDDGALTGTAQQRMIEFTGSITGNRIVTIPNDVETFYILRNSTSGAYTVQFKYATGSGSTFTFSATDKGDKILFASASPDATNPNILTLAIGTGISDVVDDTSPQLGGNLDTNSFNIAFDDAHGITDENGNEQIIFQTTGSAVNQLDITNAATGSGPEISSTGGDTNIDLKLTPKGSGKVVLDGNVSIDTGVIDLKNGGTASKVLFYCESSNAHAQTVQSAPHSVGATNTLTLPGGTTIGNSAATLVSDIGTQTLTNKTLTTPVLTTPIANAGIQLKNGATSAGFLEFFEDSDNGTNKATLIGPASTADVTVTLPASTDTLVGKATTDTLTNKTLTSPKVNEDVAVTSTATELNILDGVTSTTAELNILDGVTATAAELNYSDLSTLGTSAASKVLTANANNLTTISGAVLNTEDTLSDSSTIAWNVINSPVAKVTLAGNRTMAAPSGTGTAAGQMISLLAIQDGTGSRTITWNAVYEFPSDTAPTLTTTANLGDIFSFRYNGSKWLLIGQTLALTLS